MVAIVHPATMFPPAPPAYVQVQATGATTAPNAGAPGLALSVPSAPPSTRPPVASDNGGQLASKRVPGGTNHAPNVGVKPQSFSDPIHK